MSIGYQTMYEKHELLTGMSRWYVRFNHGHIQSGFYNPNDAEVKVVTFSWDDIQVDRFSWYLLLEADRIDLTVLSLPSEPSGWIGNN